MPGDDDALLRVTSKVAVPLRDLEWRFSPSGGPGGQHANRASTRAEVVLDLAAADLDEPVRNRLVAKLGSVVRASADEHRSQARNRSVALDRLRSTLAEALREPKRRRPTRPSKSAVQRRLDDKRRRAERKRDRSWRPSS